MKKRIFTWTCLAVVIAGFLPGSIGAESEREIALLFYDPDGVLGKSKPSFVSELDRLFAAVGARVTWLDPNPIEETTPVGAMPKAIRAILFRHEADRMKLHPAVMGVTMGDEIGDRVVYLFYPAIVRTLQLDDSEVAGDLYARAVARVLAHELVHAAAPELPHAEGGLLKARLTRRALLESHVSLDETVARALRAGIERWASRVSRRGPE
jgi:hypothetical protein